MVQDGGDVDNADSSSEGNRGSRVSGGDCCSESTDFVLDSLPSLYSELNFFSIRASGILPVHLILSTNYLTTNYCLDKFLSNISKERMPTLDGTCKRLYYFSVYTGHKRTLQYETSIQNFYTNNIHTR